MRYTFSDFNEYYKCIVIKTILFFLLKQKHRPMEQNRVDIKTCFHNQMILKNVLRIWIRKG